WLQRIPNSIAVACPEQCDRPERTGRQERFRLHSQHHTGWRPFMGFLLLFAIVVIHLVSAQGAAILPEPNVRKDQSLFQDVTAESGVRFTYRNGEEFPDHFGILETLGGGVGLIDYDGDGLLDIFVTGGGYYAGPDKKTI